MKNGELLIYSPLPKVLSDFETEFSNYCSLSNVSFQPPTYKYRVRFKADFVWDTAIANIATSLNGRYTHVKPPNGRVYYSIELYKECGYECRASLSYNC